MRGIGQQRSNLMAAVQIVGMAKIKLRHLGGFRAERFYEPLKLPGDLSIPQRCYAVLGMRLVSRFVRTPRKGYEARRWLCLGLPRPLALPLRFGWGYVRRER